MKKISVFFIFFLMFSFWVFSQGSDNLDNLIYKGVVSIPPDAESIVFFNNMPNMKGYKTKYNKNDLFYFFTSNLKQQGWHDKGTIEDMMKNHNISDKLSLKTNIDSIKTVASNAKAFEKEDNVLILSVLPQKKDKEILFTLNLATLNTKENQNLLKSFPQSIPEYPNSQLIESGNNFKKYSTLDNPEKIIKFYKNKLAFKGWVLERFDPIETKDISSKVIEKAKQYSTCEDCGSDNNKIAPDLEEEIKKIGQMSVQSGGLQFKNPNGSRCKIIITKFNSNTQWGNQTYFVIKY